MSRSEIVLIGPIRSGKSTVAHLLAKRLGLPQVSMDALAVPYYDELGYDHEFVSRYSKNDPLKVIAYNKPYEAHAVARLLAEYANCVIDLGGGHSVQDDPQLFAQVRSALEPFDNVVLLLPSPDPDESTRILRARLGADTAEWVHQLNAYLVLHPSNGALAKIVVYTKDKTPEETCEDILLRVRNVSS